MSNIDREKPCPECGEVAILDGEARICYECWQELVIAEAEEEESLDYQSMILEEE